MEFGAVGVGVWELTLELQPFPFWLRWLGPRALGFRPLGPGFRVSGLRG